MNRVLISDDVDHQCVDLLLAHGFQVEKDLLLAKKPDALIQKLQVDSSPPRSPIVTCLFFFIFLQDVDILIVRSATKVTRTIIEQSPRLKLIGRAGTGTDNIDTDAATQHGILVMKSLSPLSSLLSTPPPPLLAAHRAETPCRQPNTRVH